jgi:hypothetical protein
MYIFTYKVRGIKKFIGNLTTSPSKILRLFSKRITYICYVECFKMQVSIDFQHFALKVFFSTKWLLKPDAIIQPWLHKNLLGISSLRQNFIFILKNVMKILIRNWFLRASFKISIRIVCSHCFHLELIAARQKKTIFSIPASHLIKPCHKYLWLFLVTHNQTLRTNLLWQTGLT